MKVACRVVAIAALISILATFTSDSNSITGSLFNGVVEVSAETQSLIQFFTPLFVILATTASALSFASGVVGMVLAGQSRQHVWFTVLLAALVLQTYGAIIIVLIPAAREMLLGDPSSVYLQGQTLNDVIMPLFAPIAALFYTVRLQSSPRIPTNAGTPDDDSNLVELEYSRLDDTRAG